MSLYDDYQICYVYERTREVYYKTGRELLNCISSRSPDVISLLLHRVQSTFTEIGSMALYLYKNLPLVYWIPDEQDFNLIRGWLIQDGTSSLKNQLARYIIRELNWSVHNGTDLLALNQSLHSKTALMIIDTYREKIMGADFEKNESNWQVGNILSANSNIVLVNSNSEMLAWCWDSVLRLQLHSTNLQTLALVPLYTRTSKNLELQVDSLQAAPRTETLTGVYNRIPSACEDPSLLTVQQCAGNNISIGCYVLLSSTSLGHYPSDFLTRGLVHFECLTDSGCYKALLNVLYNLIPAFLEFDENDLLLKNAIFLKAIESLLAADSKYISLQLLPKYFSEKKSDITALFASLVQVHCFHCANHLSAIEFWTRAFLNVYDWHKNENIQLIFDELAKAAFFIPDGLEIMSKIIAEKNNNDHTSKDQQSNLLQSLFSWISSGLQGSSVRQSFLDETGNSKYSWYAFIILCADQEYEVHSGIYRQVTLELLQNDSISVDTALRKSISRLELHTSYSCGNLCIYRWVHQALVTEMTHPILPLIWQKFFSLYLSQLDCG